MPRDPHATALLLRPRRLGDFRPDVLRETLPPPGYGSETFEVIPLDDMRDAQMYPLRAASWIGALLGAIALALSISGLYGVLSYMLSQRTREIGIRMALGATAGAVVSLVMRQSVRLAGVGAAIGLALPLSRAEGPQLGHHAERSVAARRGAVRRGSGRRGGRDRARGLAARAPRDARRSVRDAAR